MATDGCANAVYLYFSIQIGEIRFDLVGYVTCVLIAIGIGDKAFTGICLMIEPGENFVPGGKPKNVWKFAASRLRGTGTAIAFVSGPPKFLCKNKSNLKSKA